MTHRSVLAETATLYLEDCTAGRCRPAHGTPCYVYSRAQDSGGFRAYDKGLRCAAAPDLLRRKGQRKPGDLKIAGRSRCGIRHRLRRRTFRVLKAGGDPAKVIFSGVGKTAAELDYALDKNIRRLQLRVGTGTRADRFARRTPRREGANRAAREPGRGRLHASLYFNRAAQAQIRDRHRASGSRLRARAKLSTIWCSKE